MTNNLRLVKIVMIVLCQSWFAIAVASDLEKIEVLSPSLTLTKLQRFYGGTLPLPEQCFFHWACTKIQFTENQAKKNDVFIRKDTHLIHGPEKSLNALCESIEEALYPFQFKHYRDSLRDALLYYSLMTKDDKEIFLKNTVYSVQLLLKEMSNLFQSRTVRQQRYILHYLKSYLKGDDDWYYTLNSDEIILRIFYILGENGNVDTAILSEWYEALSKKTLTQ